MGKGRNINSKVLEDRTEISYLMGMVVYIFNDSTREAGRSRYEVVGQPNLHREFQARETYIVTPCLRRKEKKSLILRRETTFKMLSLPPLLPSKPVAWINSRCHD